MERERSVARRPVVTRLTPDLTAIIGPQVRKDQPMPKAESIEDLKAKELKGFIVLVTKRNLLGQPIGLIGINLDIPATTREKFTQESQAESFDQASELVGLGIEAIWRSQPNRTWEKNMHADLIQLESVAVQTVVEIGKNQLTKAE